MDVRNWMTNFNTMLTSYSDIINAKIHGGFNDAYNAVKDRVRAAALDLVNKYPTARILVTGHSLGGALATVAAADLKIYLAVGNEFMVYTLGAPRVGNAPFADHLFSLFPTGTYYRIVHYDDGVPHTPPHTGTGFRHGGDEVWYSKEKGNSYKVCENKRASDENKKCSHSLWIKAGVAAHTEYFGKNFAKLCSKQQPSNTLRDVDFSNSGFF